MIEKKTTSKNFPTVPFGSELIALWQFYRPRRVNPLPKWPEKGFRRVLQWPSLKNLQEKKTSNH